MSRLTNFAAIWISGVVIVLYFGLYYVFGRDDSKFVADWLVLIGATFMSAMTFTPAWNGIKSGGKSGSDQLMISFWMVWTFVLVQRVWIITTNLPNTPDYFRLSPVSGLIATMFAIAAGYGIAAPLSNSPEVPKQQIIPMLIATAISSIISGLVIGIYVARGWVY